MDSSPKKYGLIENCNWEVAVHCPRRWESLQPTRDPMVRHCFTCLKSVYRCDSEEELRQHVVEGKCVALMLPEDEFVGTLTVLEE
jgi:hypothetical protein